MPSAPVTVGFWPRLWAFVVDSACLTVILFPAGLAVYWLAIWLESGGGMLDLIVNWALPFILIFWFWKRWLATPGKMLIPAEIVDSRTLQAPSTGQLLIRYLGYFVSMVPLGLGMLWVLFDDRNQGWHDKLAGTLVVRSEKTFFSPLTSKLIHGFSAIVALALILTVGAFGIWTFSTGPGIRGSLAQLQEAVESGSLQGVLGTTESCWQGAWMRIDDCSDPLCSLEGSFFLRSCLENARSTAETCQAVLPRNELSVAVWTGRCVELKRPGMACLLLVGTMALHCGGPGGNSKSETLNPR